jgi:hypothetical protein
MQMNTGPNELGVIVDLFQTVAIIANTAVLIYIVLRFDQAIRGASKNLAMLTKDGRDARQETRSEFDRVWRRLETFERERERD